MSRDWQKDMEDCEQALKAYETLGLDDHKEPIEAMKYWLQQYAEVRDDAVQLREKYAAEKERADRAEQERRMLTQTMLKGDRIITELREDLETAEAREQKLREALEHCIKEYPQWDSKEIAGTLMVDYMNNILSILYPKEGEAK